MIREIREGKNFGYRATTLRTASPLVSPPLRHASQRAASRLSAPLRGATLRNATQLR
jgi:hypothetical protein